MALEIGTMYSNSCNVMRRFICHVDYLHWRTTSGDFPRTVNQMSVKIIKNFLLWFT